MGRTARSRVALGLLLAVLGLFVLAPLPLFAQPAPAASASAAPRPKLPAPAVPEDPARATPRRALSGFLRAARERDFERAATFLDLRALPRGREKKEGPELASMLARVLEWRVELDPDSLPDEPSPPGVSSEGFVLSVAEIGGESYVLALQQVRDPSGALVWVFPRSTVAAVRPIYEANQRRWLEERVPDWLKQRPGTTLYLWQWLGALVLGLVAYGAARALGAAVVGVGARLASRLDGPFAELVRALRRPVRLTLAALFFELGVPYLLFPAGAEKAASRATNILYIAAGAWAVIALVRVGTVTWERRLPEDTAGQVRGLRTRLTMIRRIVAVLVGIVAAGLVLMQFEVVRSVGVSLLASAGIVGVLVGFAAQRTLGGVIAGIEMSITQPVRIGDIVEFAPGEVGTVEHIYFTYVVVRLLDDRRQIVPVTRVMAAPFANWTRSSLELLVRVELFVDHLAPIEQLRAGFLEVCRASERWDERIARVEVIDVTDKAVRVRGTASVGKATHALELQSDLRERWLSFVQQLEGGKYLPHGRMAPAATNSPDSAGTSSTASSSSSSTTPRS
ncbi:MAG: mechanosensitive ion channel family protein [Myxococcales bacterium]|nr:mechanosensitive ion channel family protein [Myxococcales bacterium]